MSEDKGVYLLVKGCILDVQGKPIPNATINTWETDANSYYDTQYTSHDGPDCRGRLKSDAEGHYQYCAVVPIPYPIPEDVSMNCLHVLICAHWCKGAGWRVVGGDAQT
jgi:protocatechuate 3,4-dioxygenase beta subunit